MKKSDESKSNDDGIQMSEQHKFGVSLAHSDEGNKKPNYGSMGIPEG
jgi:hypothetical protein